VKKKIVFMISESFIKPKADNLSNQPHTCVSQEVGLEVGALIEAAVAHGAFVRRLFHVENLVNSQSATLTESFATFDAFEWLLLRVDVSGTRKKLKIFSMLCCQKITAAFFYVSAVSMNAF
jgi:hypothetical protein